MPYNAQQVSVLQAERDLATYDGMDDPTFLAAITVEDIPVPNDVSAAEVFNAYVGSELPARSSDEWQNLMLLGSMNAASRFYLQGNVLAVLTGVFGAGTQTRTNLLALSTENISRAAELGLPTPTLGDVARTT
jgi:hypothetical protein